MKLTRREMPVIIEDELARLIEGTENSIAGQIIGELLANHSDEQLQGIFAVKGYIFKPILDWLDLYEKGEI